jgi:Rod binding domain-containing protein
MVFSPTLNPIAGPAQRLHATINSLGVQAEKANPGSQMQKLKKAAQEFEGVLLSSWLEEMQKSSLGSSDTGQDAGAETLRSLGTQAVALALAQRGGLGIAQMIVHHFSPTLRSESRSEKAG